MDRGTYIEYDGRPAVRFERTYPHPIERLWSAITEPAELARWFPSSVKIEERVEGTIEFSDDPNTEGSCDVVVGL
ncbi:MAG: SRPBCC domain-containing protein [Pseudonocardiaceae bacterium]